MPSTNGHGPKPERVALYLRVSSEEQKERKSIATQEQFLEEYCSLYGLEVAGLYKDEAISGTVPLLEDLECPAARRREGRRPRCGARLQAGPDRAHAARGRRCA